MAKNLTQNFVHLYQIGLNNHFFLFIFAQAIDSSKNALQAIIPCSVALIPIAHTAGNDEVPVSAITVVKTAIDT